ncbi:MAG: ATP-binding cassette domain-containing protein, partial [Spirochaetales bacterium]|nr:ATP-binding cassette domain-containing protein [Spirochaetales bacterium]
MEPLIKTENLIRTFSVGGEKIYAVDKISFEIAPNSFTLFQGPSGSGKTTLLNLLGTLDSPTKGRVMFKGQDITDV